MYSVLILGDNCRYLVVDLKICNVEYPNDMGDNLSEMNGYLKKRLVYKLI